MEGFPPIKLLNILYFMGCFVSCDFFSSLDAQSHWSESGVCTTHFGTSEPFKSGQKHNGVFLRWDAQDVSMRGDGGGIGQHSGLACGWDFGSRPCGPGPGRSGTAPFTVSYF
jgi:hypothetical protein